VLEGEKTRFCVRNRDKKTSKKIFGLLCNPTTPTCAVVPSVDEAAECLVELLAHLYIRKYPIPKYPIRKYQIRKYPIRKYPSRL
jgi:hypothetical protein